LSNKSPKTANNILTVLRVLLKTAAAWGLIKQMPCVIKLLRVPKSSASFYDFEQFERLVDAARADGQTAYLIALLGGEAGLRCGEMIALEWADVNVTKRQVSVARSEWKGHVTATKGGRVRHLPLTTRLTDALKEARQGVHILRHTFCSHLATRGAPAKGIQELAGHQDVATTQQYMHLSPAALDAAIRLLDAGTTSTRGNNLEAAGTGS
jgi:integrase